MDLTHKTITVDVHDWNYLKRNNINLSAEVRSYLTERVALMRGDVGGIDIELLKRKLEKKQEKHNNLMSEIRHIEKTLADYNQMVEKKRIEKLEQEKTELENQQKCINCDQVILSKKYKFKAGFVCNSCFLSTDGEQVKKWSEEAKNG